MNIKEYLNQKLKEDKIDGLIQPFGDCFCHTSGGLFMNCDEVSSECYLGKIQKCKTCDKADILSCQTDKFSYGAEGIDSCILAIKPHKDIETYLREKLVGDGHDGLYNKEGCGCRIEDEFPCGNPSSDCDVRDKDQTLIDFK